MRREFIPIHGFIQNEAISSSIYHNISLSLLSQWVKNGEYKLTARRKKARYISNGLSLNRSLAMTYSHMGTPTLPSAQLHFTSEFGMGSGGTTALLSLDKTTCMDTLASRCHGWQRETCISILKNRKVDINNILKNSNSKQFLYVKLFMSNFIQSTS